MHVAPVSLLPAGGTAVGSGLLDEDDRGRLYIFADGLLRVADAQTVSAVAR